MQRKLPRPPVVNIDELLQNASAIVDPVESEIAREMALLVINDALKYPDIEEPIIVHGSSRPLEVFDDDALNKARREIASEMSSSGEEERLLAFEQTWTEVHSSLPGLSDYTDDDNQPPTEILDVSFVPSFPCPPVLFSLNPPPSHRYSTQAS